MARQRVIATRPGPLRLEKLWNETRAAWPNALDMSDVDGDIGFDFAGTAPTVAQVQALVNAHDPTPPPPTAEQLQIATDKNLVATFMGAPSGTATPVQRDDVTKAIINYLRRSGQDA